MNIMIIDKSEHDLQMLEYLFMHEYPNATLSKFSDPMLALKYCKSHPQNLVIAAYDLKRMDGIRFFVLLRQLLPNTLNILLDDGRTHRIDAQNLMIGHMTRPADPLQLRAAINGYVL